MAPFRYQLTVFTFAQKQELFCNDIKVALASVDVALHELTLKANQFTSLTTRIVLSM